MTIDHSCNWNLDDRRSTCITTKEDDFLADYTTGVTPTRTGFRSVLVNLTPDGLVHCC